MTTREASIDHAAEARRYLAIIPASLHEEEVIATAQVHATLALVEQQRIANLIALHRHEVEHDIGAESRIYVGDPEEVISTAVLRDDIKKGLGL